MNEPWTDNELKKAINAYFKMLNHEKNNTPYVKSEANRNLQKSLPKRNSKSIEYRWQNISSVLNDHKHEFINGYKPANNVGSRVKERIWRLIIQSGLIEL
jgi:5-methylcytosine-specific restriction protein A